MIRSEEDYEDYFDSLSISSISQASYQSFTRPRFDARPLFDERPRFDEIYQEEKRAHQRPRFEDVNFPAFSSTKSSNSSMNSLQHQFGQMKISKGKNKVKVAEENYFNKEIIGDILNLQFCHKFRQLRDIKNPQEVIPRRFDSVQSYQRIWLPHFMFETYSVLLNQKAQQRQEFAKKVISKPNCFKVFVRPQISRSDPLEGQSSSRLNMFFTQNSKFVKKNVGFISESEQKLLDQVRIDDLVILSQNRIQIDPCFNDNIRQNLESDKLIKFLQKICKQPGVMVAYVNKSHYPKGVLQNYLTVLISPGKMKFFDNLKYSEGKMDMFLYHYDSLLTQSRQYQALKNVQNIPTAPLLMNPQNFGKMLPSKTQQMMQAYFKQNQQLFNSSQAEVLQKVIEAQKNSITLVQGPPGTGKTHTIRGIVSMLIDAGVQKIQICTPSNKAVDEIISRISQNGLIGENVNSDFSKLNLEKELLRVGSLEYQASPTIQKHSLDYRVNRELNIRIFETYEMRLQIISQIQSSINIEPKLMLIQLCKPFLEKSPSKMGEQKGKKQQLFFASLIEVLKSLNEMKPRKENSKNPNIKFIESLVQQLKKFNPSFPIEVEKFIICPPDQEKVKSYLRKIEDLLKKLSKIDQSDKKKEEWRKIQQQLMIDAKIISSTLSMVGSSKFEVFEANDIKLDYLIVDEACQSNELETLIAMKLKPERVILVGDNNQLPATVISKNHETTKYSRSLFERLLECELDKTMLKVQYRMHPNIRRFPSNKFYDGQLSDHQCIQQRSIPQEIQVLTNSFKKRVVFIDLPNNFEDKDGKSTRNSGEAIFTHELIKHIINKQEPGANLQGKIGVISSYKSQVHLLLNEMGPKISSSFDDAVAEVNTVDSFQGREKDVIIFNCVRANQHGNIGFLKDIRRLNVAITRAKHFLILIGNSKTLSSGSKVWKDLIKDVRQNGVFLEVKNKINKAQPPQVEQLLK